jgi:hypothetical protein
MSEGLIMTAGIEVICDLTGFQAAKITSGSCEEDEKKGACPQIDRFLPKSSLCRRSYDSSHTEGSSPNANAGQDMPLGDEEV